MSTTRFVVGRESVPELPTGKYVLRGADFNSTGVHWTMIDEMEHTVVRVALEGDHAVPEAELKAIIDVVNFILVPGSRPPGSIPEYSRWTYDQIDDESSYVVREAASGEVLFRGLGRAMAATIVGRHNDDVKRLQYAAYLSTGARPATLAAEPRPAPKVDGINVTQVLGPLDDLDDYGRRSDRLVSGEVTLADLKSAVQKSICRLAEAINATRDE